MKCHLVLSGGGTRGYAHIGVVKALIEKGVTIQAVSGSSCGAIIGALLCDGFSADDIASLLLEHEPELGLNYRNFRQSLLSFDAYTRVLKTHLKSGTFEDLKMPLHVSLTNLQDGRQQLISKGDLLLTLIATAAIPVLLPPQYINGVPYADGGLSSNLPVEPFLESDLPIIGVHANPLTEFDPKAGFMHRLDRSLHLLMRNNVMANIPHCTLFIEPPGLKNHHLFESKKTQELVMLGYRHVMENVDLTLLNHYL